MVYEHYHILDISFQASADEIKQAYFRLVRKYSPEKAPEQFQQIRVAYNTLFDPKARDIYDAMQKHGNEINNLINQAEKNIQLEEWSTAIPLLKQVLVLAPQMDAARNLLGLCYIHTKNWDFAIKIYKTLTKTNPDVAVYWIHFGCAYKLQAECFQEQRLSYLQLYHNARECYHRAIDLESFNSAPYLEIAETYLSETNYSEALTWANLAIGADGKADYNDFEAFFFICRVHFCNNELHKIEVIAKRIISLLPENILEIRQYAANRFANMGIAVAKVAEKYVDFNMWRAAFEFLKVAKTLDNSHLGMKQICAKIEEIVSAINQYESLSQDDLIIQGIQRLAAFCLADYFDYYDSLPQRKSFLNDILTEILASPTTTIFSSLERIKFYYPMVYGLNTELFNRIEEVACVA